MQPIEYKPEKLTKDKNTSLFYLTIIEKEKKTFSTLAQHIIDT